jgi:valyl-tRNA synthetase
MNAEQLSRLSEFKNSAITYTDAYDLISKKILINKLSIENLNNQIEHSIIIKTIQDLIINIATEKKQLIIKLNNLLEMQLKEFTDIVQVECNDIYGYINELDEPTPEYIKYAKQLKELENKMQELNYKIQTIENTIPQTQLVTNYSIKLTQDNCNDLEMSNAEYNE